MKSIKVTPAKLKDFVEVLALIKEYFAYDHIAWNPHIRMGLRKILTDKSLGQVWIISTGQEIAGYAVLTYSFDLEYAGKLATITDFYIRRKFRKLGIGTEVMRIIKKFCKHRRLRAIELQVEKTNRKARFFIRK